MRIGIIGGGPIGLISALALQQNGHNVRLFDPATTKPKMSLPLAESTLVFLESFDACLFLLTNFIYPADSLILEEGIAFYTVLALELFEKRPVIESLKVVIHSEAV